MSSPCDRQGVVGAQPEPRTEPVKQETQGTSSPTPNTSLGPVAQVLCCSGEERGQCIGRDAVCGEGGVHDLPACGVDDTDAVG